MINSTKYLALVSLLLVISCTNNQELKDDDQKARDALVGVWRGAGEYQDDANQGWNELWKMTRHQDGSFEVSYLLTHDGNKQYEITSDSGKWFYENGSYFEVNVYDQKSVYKVYSVKKDWFEYNFIQRGDDVTIQETKTVDNYQLQGHLKAIPNQCIKNLSSWNNHFCIKILFTFDVELSSA